MIVCIWAADAGHDWMGPTARQEAFGRAAWGSELGLGEVGQRGPYRATCRGTRAARSVRPGRCIDRNCHRNPWKDLERLIRLATDGCEDLPAEVVRVRI